MSAGGQGAAACQTLGRIDGVGVWRRPKPAREVKAAFEPGAVEWLKSI